MDLECRHVVIGGRGVLLVRGELDLATVPQFRDQLSRAAASSDGGTLYVIPLPRSGAAWRKT